MLRLDAFDFYLPSRGYSIGRHSESDRQSVLDFRLSDGLPGLHFWKKLTSWMPSKWLNQLPTVICSSVCVAKLSILLLQDSSSSVARLIASKVAHVSSFSPQNLSLTSLLLGTFHF